MTGEVTVWTVGHSTLPLDAFVGMLGAQGIETIADVRRFPGSRRQPQFGSESLEAALAAHDIAYRWIAPLGGRRRPDPLSPNTAWRHPAFRAYADHLASEEFAVGLMELMMIACGTRTAIMCAEVLWWRCHRRLIADALVSIGVDVVHILGERETTPHRIAEPARLVGGALTYQEPAAP